MLRSERLRDWLEEVRRYPKEWGSRRERRELRTDLALRIAAADRYEGACDHAIEASGIVAARRSAQDLAQDLHSMLFEIRQHEPQTVAGVLILARAVAAYEEAQAQSYTGGERGGGLILGRELATAVLRVAGITA